MNSRETATQNLNLTQLTRDGGTLHITTQSQTRTGSELVGTCSKVSSLVTDSHIITACNLTLLSFHPPEPFPNVSFVCKKNFLYIMSNFLQLVATRSGE